jgi:hypothetical protein
MNKFLVIFKKASSFRSIDLNMKKKVLFFDKEFDKFTIKEVYLKEFFKEGKSLVLSPYPCKFIC